MTTNNLGRWESLGMVQKSIRQLAKEIGVSASYLSQIRHDKIPASRRVLNKMLSKML